MSGTGVLVDAGNDGEEFRSRTLGRQFPQRSMVSRSTRRIHDQYCQNQTRLPFHVVA